MIAMKITLTLCLSTAAILLCSAVHAATKARDRVNFGNDWKFNLGETARAQDPSFDDSGWRNLNLPHDWSIEGEFSKNNPATPEGGALPGGIAWYRKTFLLPETEKSLLVFVDFDGVYRNSEVWINGHSLGVRPNGYISFRYELTPYLNYGNQKNVIAVRVDNSKQPNSRWYSGSGIYRNVWLVTTNKVFVDHWGTFTTTPEVSQEKAKIHIVTRVRNKSGSSQPITLNTFLSNKEGKEEGRVSSRTTVSTESFAEVTQELTVDKPDLWSVDTPNLYKAVSQVVCEGKICDEYQTAVGLRYFAFDREKGFLLNGRPLKIKGVCNHHDLGCMGAAINTRALERQLEIMKAMGVNGIRTSHNPSAPELLDLCDGMGFIVMDEAFDMWKKPKNKFDYHLDWDQWHKRDLEDQVLRDRNHPSVFIWSIGNEIPEQGSSGGIEIARELAAIVRSLDKTRPITSACDDPRPSNNIIKSGVLDLIGFNYHQNDYPDSLKRFSEKAFIASETTSAIASRGHYDLPSDVIRRWPPDNKKQGKMNDDFTCSAYDNCSVPWGSTHEETWKIIKKYDFLAGMFIWTGFDYLGEPTPYKWPARSSYFGIVDLCGFPKDAYYFYQSEWTGEPVLHVFPHWNWRQGDIVDVWAYSNAEEVELFLNGKSLGAKQKSADEMHLMWRVPFAPGILKGLARSLGKETLTTEVKTAGKPARIVLSADRNVIRADGSDLSFVTVKIVDRDDNLVPDADNLVKFNLAGQAIIAGVDNGSPISHEPFKASYRKAFNGMCLAVIQSKEKVGKIELTAVSEGLQPARVVIEAK